MWRSASVEWETVFSNTDGSDQVIPCGPWRAVDGMKYVQCEGEMRNRTTLFNGAIGVQFGADENNPDATAVKITADINANGTIAPTNRIDVGSSAQNKRLWRPCWITKNTTGQGTALNVARMTGRWSWSDC